jgi:hypothetical protein
MLSSVTAVLLPYYLMVVVGPCVRNKDEIPEAMWPSWFLV